MAVALVAVHQVDAASIIQAGAAVAFVNLVTTDGSHVAGVADAGVGVNPILALAMVARIRVTVVDVLITQCASETRGTQTLEAIDFVHTLPIVYTRVALAFIHLQFTMHTFETRHAETGEASDLVQAGGVVLTGV